MPRYTKNPFARQVQMNTIRESEVLVRLIKADAPPITLGELTSISYSPQTSTRTINIGGQSGKEYRKTTQSGVQVQFGYKVGTDGSRWRKMWEEEQNGTALPFTLEFASSDHASPNIGEEVSALAYCNITDLQNAMSMNASGSGDREATVTIWGTSETLVQFFNEIQGN